jgi:hypothetical protein
MHTSEPTAAPRARSTLALVLLGPLAVWIGTVLFGSAFAADSLPEGQCEGIGWGCTLTPRDTLLITGMVLGVVVVPIATVIAAVVARCSSTETEIRNVVLLLGLYAGATLVFVAAVASSST